MACTDRVDGYPAVIPMCIDCETGVLIRRETGGFLIAWSDPQDPPGFDTTVDPLFLPKLAERIGNRSLCDRKEYAGRHRQAGNAGFRGNGRL